MADRLVGAGAVVPLMAILTAISVVQQPPVGGAVQWWAFAYLAVVSMFLGFFAWYRGLAVGPMAQVSQTQLAQPVLSIGWAALLLGEHLNLPTILGGGGGVVVIACALVAVRSRGGRPTPQFERTAA